MLQTVRTVDPNCCCRLEVLSYDSRGSECIGWRSGRLHSFRSTKSDSGSTAGRTARAGGAGLSYHLPHT